MGELLGYRIWSTGGVQVVSTPAEIDIANAAELRHALLAASGNGAIVVVDMSSTTFCDSKGLSVLIRAWKRITADGGELRIAGCAPPVLRIMALTSLDRILTIFATLPEALPGNGKETPQEPR